MTSEFDEIFSLFMGRITDFAPTYLSEDDWREMEIGWLRAAMSDQRFRKLFETFTVDADAETFEYKLRNPVDDYSDQGFVNKLLAVGMAVEWLQPQVDSVLNTAPMIGGKEEKKLLDNHSNMIARLKQLKIEQKKMIRDYGYYYNSYVNGE